MGLRTLRTPAKVLTPHVDASSSVHYTGGVIRRALIVALFWLAAGCGRTPIENSAVCPHDLDAPRIVPIEVVISSSTTRIRHDVSLADLAKFPGVEEVGTSGHLQGLTVYEAQIRTRTSIAVSRKLFTGTSCAWIDRLTVDLTPKSLEILVPSDYPEGSCQYDQILSHERQHDDTNRDALAETAQTLRQSLAQANWLPAKASPLAVADRSDAQRRIDAMLDHITQPIYAAHTARLKERQEIIDLPENYRWVARRCEEWR